MAYCMSFPFARTSQGRAGVPAADKKVRKKAVVWRTDDPACDLSTGSPFTPQNARLDATGYAARIQPLSTRLVGPRPSLVGNSRYDHDDRDRGRDQHQGQNADVGEHRL